MANPEHSNDPADQVALPDQEKLFRAPARFGNIPVETPPKGWDPKNPGFRNHYPVINLPTQIVDRVSFGAPELEPNRLIWGDNLHVMRQIESESVDLIYIDPPFFSNRNYNVIWGDQNEERSFSDIWEGGLDGYLIWLNARLYEMKRLLKPTGSIYVHCDWHASHYIKVEMDKIFGYENFRNEVVWRRVHALKGTRSRGRTLGSVNDRILFYAASNDVYIDVPKYDALNEVRHQFKHKDDRGLYRTHRLIAGAGMHKSPLYEWRGLNPPYGWHYSKANMDRMEAEGRIHYNSKGTPQRKEYLDEYQGRDVSDVWLDVPIAMGKERVGYPTQKPEELLARIIRASSNEGETVLDVFIGGGTTAVVAQRLGRRWIAMDQSRVAVAVTAERLKNDATTRELGDDPLPDCTIEHWGVYEADKLSQMPALDFRQFVLHCYDARVPSEDDGIHGYKGARARIPIWVGSPQRRERATAEDVNAFAEAITRLDRYQGDEGLRDGTMLAWGFRRDAQEAARLLRERDGLELGLVRLNQIALESAAFRSHVAGQSTERGDYSEFLTFVQPPLVEIAHKRIRGRTYDFSAADSQVFNAGAKLVNVQWDFNHRDGVFRAERATWFGKKKGKDAGPPLEAQHSFQHLGTFTVACKVQDDKGGEGMETIVVRVE